MKGRQKFHQQIVTDREKLIEKTLGFWPIIWNETYFEQQVYNYELNATRFMFDLFCPKKAYNMHFVLNLSFQ